MQSIKFLFLLLCIINSVSLLMLFCFVCLFSLQGFSLRGESSLSVG